MSDLVPQSGLIVEVPEAEAVVGPHRYALDANARLGVPAHFTVLFPFMPPDQIDSTVLHELRQLFAKMPAFDVKLTHTSWFDDAVLWLAPEDPQPLQNLTERVYEAFPDFPPFAGEFPNVVPHLTVAHGCDIEEMRAAERAVAGFVPIHGRARKVTLLIQPEPGGAWSPAAYFMLEAET